VLVAARELARQRHEALDDRRPHRRVDGKPGEQVVLLTKPSRIG
jgi:hypothetical protein